MPMEGPGPRLVLFRDPYSRGAEELAVPEVAAARLVDDGSRCAVEVSNGRDGLMARRVEGLADAFERFHPLGFEQAPQQALHPVQPSGDRGRRLIQVSQGAIEAVGQIDEGAQQLPLGLPCRRVTIAFDPAPVILEVGFRPHVAVVFALQLVSQLFDPGLLRGLGW